MKALHLLTCIVIACVPCSALAAKGNKKKGKGDKKAQQELSHALGAFDKNHNATIDGDEIAAVKKAFNDAPTGALAALDANKNGQADDSEITAIKLRTPLGPVLKPIDKDGNHRIEGAEVEALQKKFTEDPKGALAILDRNKNGKLDEDEIKVLNERLGKRAAGGKHKKSAPAPAAKPTTPSTTEPKPEAKKGEEIRKAEDTPPAKPSAQ